MEIRVLRYFLETAREGNMTRAAERLFISQPTMSKQLKELEKELGVKLFVRSNYNIQLTDAGILLRERAEDILSLVDKTKAEFKTLEEWGSLTALSIISMVDENMDKTITGADIRASKTIEDLYNLANSK